MAKTSTSYGGILKKFIFFFLLLFLPLAVFYASDQKLKENRSSAASLIGDGGANNVPKPDSVRIIYPNGGEKFKVGETVRITWESRNKNSFYLGWTLGPGSLNNIKYLQNYDKNYYDWKVDAGNMLPRSSRKIKIDILAYPQTGTFVDQSDNFFTVTAR